MSSLTNDVVLVGKGGIVLDRIVVEGSVIVDDMRRTIRILLGDEEGASSIWTLRRADSSRNKHLFNEIDEGVEAIVWDPVIATINIFVWILEANTVSRSMRVGFEVSQLFNEDVCIPEMYMVQSKTEIRPVLTGKCRVLTRIGSLIIGIQSVFDLKFAGSFQS